MLNVVTRVNILSMADCSAVKKLSRVEAAVTRGSSVNAFPELQFYFQPWNQPLYCGLLICDVE